MIEETLTDPSQVTIDRLVAIYRSLMTNGAVSLHVDEGYGVKRMVFAVFPDEREIMVAMEGNGCLFLQQGNHINPFVFVTGGFQFKAAHIAAAIFVGLAKARASLDEIEKRALPQLEDKRS